MMSLLTKMSLKVFIIPPGKFYHGARKLNLIMVNPGYNYIFTLSYSVTKHLSTGRNPCKSDLAWKEDDCKINKGRTTENNLFFYFILQLTESIRDQFNCSVPWLRHLTPDLRICQPNIRQVSDEGSLLNFRIINQLPGGGIILREQVPLIPRV